MNKVILMGRLTRDPDIRSSQSDNPITVARFTIAVDRRFKRDSDQSADFISCVAFGKTAEFFDKFVKQGTKVCVEGRIQTGSYQDKDGKTVSICGQAPSVYPDYAEFLVRAGIDSISVNPDRVIYTKKTVSQIEQRMVMDKITGRGRVTDADVIW